MMTSQQIEMWASRVIDAVNSGHPSEDHRVELKSNWPPPEKAARLIAGHANAARGEDILWLIGVDEKIGVTGADANNLANWYPSVEAFFNELAPRLTDINMPVLGKTVVALLFETDRAPFVVKNPDYGKGGVVVQLEVPWRENTATRTARRSDLIRLLSPLDGLPDIEILESKLYSRAKQQDLYEDLNFSGVFSFTSVLYLVPKTSRRIVFPFHKMQISWEIKGIVPKTNFSQPIVYLDIYETGEMLFFRDSPVPENKSLATITQTELIVDGPCSFRLNTSLSNLKISKEAIGKDVDISIHLFSTHAERPVVATTTIPYPSPEDS